MNYVPREHSDGLEADRRQERGACGHGRNCTCIKNIGPEGVKAITARLKAENDRLNRPNPPLGRYLRRIDA